MLIEETRLLFVPTGDLQTEAGAALRMKLGLAGDPFPGRKEAWRVHACVVGHLHVRPGRGLPALGGPPQARPPGPPLARPWPAPGLSIFPDARSLGEGGSLDLRARPRLGSLRLGVDEDVPSHRLPIGARVQATHPIGPYGFGHQIQRF